MSVFRAQIEPPLARCHVEDVVCPSEALPVGMLGDDLLDRRRVAGVWPDQEG
jgi:hypothetical protein